MPLIPPDTIAATYEVDPLPAILLGFFHRMARSTAIRSPQSPSRHDQKKEDIAKSLESEGSDLSELRRYESYRWCVEYDGAMVGSVALKSISHTMGYAEIGYGIGEAYQGKGMATLAVGLLVDMCFRGSPLRKLLAYVHDRNVLPAESC